ncbi:Rdx family protein [Halostagnicola sp. A-GB9-2]|uniref:SelT/SelW/SelH family protein n=1 Tax=Halostagnicola sp. A-GB9-2 TaxID=3048066 RepID=UPI0024C012F9|nr:Rdx family protein [Halostagnicola sp. A-GB9-2]MDJ1430714.1 Rdx family protein [Halostagnicola sp. A-GB9-2]
MATVEIEYCVPCGFLSRAMDIQRTLLTTFGEQLEAVTLKTGADGIFVVRFDGEVVYDKSADGFDVDEIVRYVRTQL